MIPVVLPVCLHPDILEAGVDEAGRGCLAGPVVAAAVILPPDFALPGLNDSKKLSEHQRETMRSVIEQKALAWAVGTCSPEEIDRLNILNAAIEAMHRALALLTVTPTHIIVDGNKFKPFGDIPHTTIVKGDAKYAAIAAASIIAKTTRDRLMYALHRDYPQYLWAKNKGYPTPAHRAAIAAHGPSPHHRSTFRLL